jgi:hypothetical protein
VEYRYKKTSRKKRMDNGLSSALAVGLSLLELPVGHECLCHTSTPFRRFSSICKEFTLYLLLLPLFPSSKTISLAAFFP